MKLLVTGATGFIGRALAKALLQQPGLERLTLADRSVDVSDSCAACGLNRPGDMTDAAYVRSLVDAELDTVFHLAGIVSGAAEADFDLGMRVNVDGTRVLLDACRSLARAPRFVYASSIAVFGAPLPSMIDDRTLPAPTLSYGMQKLICEQLINDYTRRGFIDGRALRLPGIVVRPPLPNGALSAFNSDIIREPLAGREVVSPVSAEATLWIMSIDRCVQNLLHAATLPADALGQQRALNLPPLAVSIGDILDALRTLSTLRGGDAGRFVKFEPNAAVEAMFGRWPRAHDCERARALGFAADRGIVELVRAYALQA